MTKKNLLITAILSISCFIANAQKPEDYDPFYRKGNGTLTLNSGEQIKGFGTFYILGSSVKFFKEFDDKAKSYNVSDVKSFAINDSVWFAKLTKGAEVSFSKKKTFVYLKSAPTGKMKMYQRAIIESDVSVAGALGLTDRLKLDYFVGSEEDDDVQSITGFKFMPFSKKVSALLADCPALSQKIADKAAGYSPDALPKLGGGLKKTIDDNIAARPENVWLKVINEYNACSK